MREQENPACQVFRRVERTGLRLTGCSHHDSAYGVARTHRLLLKHSLPSANGGAKKQVRVLSSARNPSQVGLVERTCASQRNTLKQTDEIDVKGDWKPYCKGMEQPSELPIGVVLPHGSPWAS